MCKILDVIDVHNYGIQGNGRGYSTYKKTYDELQNIINQMPTVSGEGTDFSLENTINAPLVELKVKGTTNQESNPSAENPQTIHMVTGNIEVTTSNQNIETKFTFPLLDGQYLCDGDYLADDGIHNKKKIDTVNVKSVVNLYNGNVGGVYTPTTKIPQNNNYSFCSKSIFDRGDTRVVGTYYENIKNFVFIGDKTDTLASLKSKYNGAIIIYELNNEIITPYTDVQKQAYEQLKKMRSYADTTYVTSNSNDIAPTINIKALKKIVNETNENAELVNNVQIVENTENVNNSDEIAEIKESVVE